MEDFTQIRIKQLKMEDFTQIRIKQLKEDYENCGFPRTNSEYTVEEQMLPMRDGRRMKTVIYRPVGSERYPVLLRRTCYPSDKGLIQVDAENCALRGYAFVYQFCRGTGGSEGEWFPNINERDDGIDTVNWICEQPWCEAVGYWGASYTALTGWAFADAAKGKVSSMFLVHYGTDRFASAYHKGLFHHDILTSWSMQNAGRPVDADYISSCRYLPHIEVDEALWGGKLSWYRDYISNEYPEDAYWQQGWWKQLREIPSKVEIPLYILSGWYDHHHESAMKTWSRLRRETRKMSWLEIGGWNHGLQPVLQDKKVENIENVEAVKALTWFELTLKKKQMPEQKIRYYVPGKDCWMEADSWEKIPRQNQTLYLDADHQSLCQDVSGLPTSTCGYTYDPDDPVPTNGGDCTLASWLKTGSLLQEKPGWREDVVSFLSEPLEKERIINGQIEVELWVRTDRENTAFFASIDEMTPEGNSYHIRTSGTTIRHELPRGERYVPGTPVKVTLDMSDICYALPAGSRIRIDVTSSDFPQYHAHSNQPGDWAEAKENVIAHQTILTGKDYPSCVKIPCQKT